MYNFDVFSLATASPRRPPNGPKRTSPRSGPRARTDQSRGGSVRADQSEPAGAARTRTPRTGENAILQAATGIGGTLAFVSFWCREWRSTVV